MNAPLSRTKVFSTLIRREFLEQRLLFLLLPLAGTALGMLLYAYLFAEAAWTGELAAPMEQAFRSMPRQSQDLAMNAMYVLPLQLMMACYWITMAFYFLTTLQQQRKNRSVLFWNSLPVSDAQTVLSKLVAGLLCCHVIYIVCYLALALFLMLVSLAWGMSLTDLNGESRGLAAAWGGLVAPARLPALLTTMVLSLPVNILWTLPVYGWCLLVSARMRNVPFVWAMAPIALIILVEITAGGWLVYGRARSLMLENLIWHAAPLSLFEEAGAAGNLFSAFAVYPWRELFLGTVLGAFFVYAAIRLNRPDDI